MFSLFLQKHGNTLRELLLDEMSPKWDIFNLCPNLQTVAVVAREASSCINASFFASVGPHLHLQKIILRSFGYVNSETFAEMYHANLLVCDLSPFQALQEVQIDACVWPRSEREIKKSRNNLWIRISEKWRDDYGVRLTDRNGTHWTSRLGSKKI
jgi:hypothetical protein